LNGAGIARSIGDGSVKKISGRVIASETLFASLFAFKRNLSLVIFLSPSHAITPILVAKGPDDGLKNLK
jgi:hypothetical protein